MSVLQQLLTICVLAIFVTANNHLPYGGNRRTNSSNLRKRSNSVKIMTDSGSRTESLHSDLLPRSHQEWIHAVDNKNTLLEALSEESTVTAIETDVLMGHALTATDQVSYTKREEVVPIMAHPPHTESDLPMTDFLDILSQHANDQKEINRVIKLDFKELEPVEPTLQAIVDRGLRTAADNSGTFFLNADILPGPGFRKRGAVTIPASQFLETCLKYIRRGEVNHSNNTAVTTRFAFSLGFKTDCTSTEGYAAGDVQSMSDFIGHYKLLPEALASTASPDSVEPVSPHWVGVVLALNARQLVRSMDKFDSIMERFPDLQILVYVTVYKNGTSDEVSVGCVYNGPANAFSSGNIHAVLIEK